MLFKPLANLIKNHYNDTIYYLNNDVEKTDPVVDSFTRTVGEIVFSDVITLSVLYYILSNL